MTKRARFFLVAVMVGVMSYLVGLVSVDYRFHLVLALSAISYILFVYALFDDLKGIEWFSLMVLPVMYVLGGNLFANFLPNAVPSLFGWQFSIELSQILAVVIRIIYYGLFVLGVYGLLLVENIFSVAAMRTIQLYRAARSVSFLFAMLTFIFFVTTFFSLKMVFWLTAILIFLVTVLISFPQYWSVDLKQTDNNTSKRYAYVTGWLVMLVTLPLSFWPVVPVMGALLSTSM
jgi:hypothetical protein